MTDLDEIEQLLREATAGPIPETTAYAMMQKRMYAIDEEEWDLFCALRNAAEELIRDARRYRDLDVSGIVHDAVLLALDEAGVRNEVLRGMCLEVAIEKAQDALTLEAK